jgi:hypothetical protein
MWRPDPASPLTGSVALVDRPLPRLEAGGAGGLRGRDVRVLNRGQINAPDPVTGRPEPTPIGPARPDAQGNYLFQPGRGGGRLDKVDVADAGMRERYVEAAHFGEVNTYFHLDRIAQYVNGLLRELGAPRLPPVTAVVCAHNCAVEVNGRRDGVLRLGRPAAFQGGHYRLPARRYDVPEWYPIEPTGEIHVGPGRQLLRNGALVEHAGGPYRANASHNAGILYHEYGHHLTRHTADFRANRRRRPERQDNVKTALDEGTSDYWAAALLDSPHIWAWHHHHAPGALHPRSLASAKTMASFDPRPQADPHANGTIWGAALWDVRRHVARVDSGGARLADLLVLQALLLVGVDQPGLTLEELRLRRAPFAAGLRALVAADELRCAGRHGAALVEICARRGITADEPVRATREVA